MNDRDILRSQAERGEWGAMLDLALDFALGIDGPVDANEARLWFERIIEDGNTSRVVEVQLGRLLVEGSGGPQDLLRGLSMLRPHGHEDPEAAVWAARAARMLASEQYAHVVARQDRAELARELNDPDGRDFAEQELEATAEAERFLDAFPEQLPGPWPAPSPWEDFLERVALRESERTVPTDELSPAELTRHWVNRVLRLAALHIGRPFRSSECPSDARACRVLDGWFDQREEELSTGAPPQCLPAAELGSTMRHRLQVLRRVSVLLEPVRTVHGPGWERVHDDTDVQALATPDRDIIQRIIDKLEAGSMLPIAPILDALSELGDPEVCALLPRLTPHVRTEQPSVTQLALRAGTMAPIDAMIGAPMPLRSRVRMVEALVRAGESERTMKLAHTPPPTEACLWERSVETGLLEAALHGSTADEVFARAVSVGAPPSLADWRRLALLGVRGHSDPGVALTMLAERLLPMPDQHPFHTIGSWQVVGRIDLLAAAFVEWQTGIPMDSPQ